MNSKKTSSKTEIDNIEICSKCGQPLLTDTLLKRLHNQHETAKKYQREYKRKQKLLKKLSKDVKPLTQEEMESIKGDEI
jgi:hypothetical protein